jgi:hypothetical protein
MHVCDACNIIMYSVAMILLLIPLILYVSSNYMFTLLSHLTSFKCILHKYENVSVVALPDKWVDGRGRYNIPPMQGSA